MARGGLIQDGLWTDTGQMEFVDQAAHPPLPGHWEMSSSQQGCREWQTSLLLLLDPGLNASLAGDLMLPPDRTPKPAGSPEAVTGIQAQVDTRGQLPSALSCPPTLG